MRGIDDITDNIEEAAQLFITYNIREIRPDAIQMVEKINECLGALVEAMVEFRHYKKSRKLTDLIIEVNKIPKTVRAKGLVGDESIAISHSIAQAAIHAKQALLVTDAPSDARFARAASIQEMNIRSAMCAPALPCGTGARADLRRHVQPARSPARCSRPGVADCLGRADRRGHRTGAAARGRQPRAGDPRAAGSLQFARAWSNRSSPGSTTTTAR